MSINQQHGTIFENWAKLAEFIKGANQYVGQNHIPHDVPAKLDLERNLPTSIKVINNAKGILCLADAPRFVKTMNDTGMRKLVGVYDQSAQTKTFHTVFEFLLLPEHNSWLFGDVTLKDVNEVRSLITLANIPVQDVDKKAFDKGVELAGNAVKELRKKRNGGLVQFNPKIGQGSGKERRLQASVSLPALWEKLKEAEGSVRHTDSLGNFCLPLVLASTPRVNAVARPEFSLAAAA